MTVVVIPAYKPEEALLQLLRELGEAGLSALVVDDGSGEAFAPVFAEAEKTAVVIHAPRNEGKGAALKRGMRALADRYPDCTHFITADADGQHKTKDILRVAAALGEGAPMVLTTRDLKGNVPLRSRVGNDLSRWIYTVLTGHYLADNQSGLRGFSIEQIDWLLLAGGNKYDYEMNVLYYADKQHIPMTTLPIETVYIEGNRSSHFQPVPDTLRIYKRLFSSAWVTFLSLLLCETALIAATVTYGYERLEWSVPLIGAGTAIFCVGLNAVQFNRIHYRDGSRVLLYAAIRFSAYWAWAFLFKQILPAVPMVIAVDLLALVMIPARYFIHKHVRFRRAPKKR